MDPAAKAKFILALHKHSLEAFDSGGTVLSGPGTDATNQNAVNNTSNGFTGAISNALGTGNNFQAGAANLQAGTNVGQLNQGYNNVLGGINGQQNFVDEANKLNGFGNQFNTFQQQQALSNQLQQQALGQGPNPAQAALAQSTGQNVANQAALMASQRGASANAGLIARQAAQQGAGIQQQAAGQSATLQAQQQLAAQAALANQQAQMQQVASNQIAAQGQGATNLSNAQQNEQNILQGANTAFNNAAVSQQGNINNVNASTAQANQQANSKTLGGITNALSNIPVIGSFFAQGGMVHKYAEGGLAAPALAAPSSQGPQSFAGQWLNSNVPPGGSPAMSSAGPALPGGDIKLAEIGKGHKNQNAPLAYNPTMPNTDLAEPEMGSQFAGSGYSSGAGSLGAAPAAESLDPFAMPEMAPLALAAFSKGGGVAPALDASGGKVKAGSPNQKASKKDNSYSNDKIPALLSEGEIVLPRKVTMHPNAPQKAAEFVQAVLAKKRMGKK